MSDGEFGWLEDEDPAECPNCGECDADLCGCIDCGAELCCDCAVGGRCDSCDCDHFDDEGE